MDQQAIMKRKMISAIVFAVIMAIGLLVFIGLYIDETKLVQQKYREQYHTSLAHVSEDIDSYLNAEGDKDMRYTRIVCDASNADSFAFLLDDFTEKQKTVNELYTCLLKYPEQMREKLEDVKTAVNDMKQELDKGYEKADEIIASVNKKGN
ncbi:MAG: hypothetical protein IKR76_11460 [Ruminococcus sp.]|nr:hypothetical protein [Ruminococcus sp.]